MASLFTWLGALIVLVPICYMYTVSVVAMRFPALLNKRICLLIAHPDDEAMFFAPTVLALTRPETGNHVKILCLSSGNAEGLGETRKQELVRSALKLGLRSENDVFVVDRPDFPDSMTTLWNSGSIATLLSTTFSPTPTTIKLPTQNMSASTKAAVAYSSSSHTSVDTPPPVVTIDVLITFDHGGISGHPNHISLYRGARHFIASLTKGKPGWQPPVDLYTLTTVPLLRKYTSVLDAITTILASWMSMMRAAGGKSASTIAHPRSLVFLADLHPSSNGGLVTAWQAMTTAHRSQMAWFRYGWIAFSRYMVVNDLRLERDFGRADMDKA